MRIRPYREADLEELKRMHEAMGFDYLFPELDHPRFFTKLVVEDEGRVVMALVGKLTSEMMFMMRPDEGSTKQRLQWFLELHQASEKDMALYGLDECFAEIPPGPKMEKFKRLLAVMGWVPMNTWDPWCRPYLLENPKLVTIESLSLFEGAPQRGIGSKAK